MPPLAAPAGQQMQTICLSGFISTCRRYSASLNIGRSFQGKRLPITIMQMRALSLFNERETVTITDISRSLGMSLQSATNLVCRLEQLGYLERSKNEKDKRVSDVRLTAKGKKRLNAFRNGEVENVRLLLERLEPRGNKSSQ